jgi:hypothetical protein
MASTIKSLTKKASKSRLAWVLGLGAIAAASVAAAVYVGEKSANASPALPPGPGPSPAPGTLTGGTITVPITAPSGGGTTGNLGVVAIPYGSTLILTAPASSSIASVSPSVAGMVSPVSTNSSSYTLQMSAAYNSAPTIVGLTIVWTDQNGVGNTSTLQIAPQTSTVALGLTPGQMPNLILPATAGQMLFLPPASATVQSGSVSGTGVAGQVYQAAAGSPGGSYGVLAAGAGVAVATINWTDSGGNAQTSTVNVTTTAT